jgi:HD superfamily phosphohydrolase
MAQKMIDTLKQKHDELNDIDLVKIIRLTALLHDIGHLPFGHTLEDECSVIQGRHDQWQRLEKYIGLGTEIGAILVSLQCFDEVKSVLKMLSKESMEGNTDPYIADLVGNTICADLFDYLKRDGKHCGLNLEYDDRLIKYFEIDHLSKHLVVRLDKDGEFRRDNVSELIGLLISRYSLAEKVLFHHAKISASAMLARALHLAKLEEKQVLNLGDEQLLYELEHGEDKTVIELVRALQERKLHKLMFRFIPEYANVGHIREKLAEILHKNPEYRESLTIELEERFDMPKGSLCIYCPDENMLFKAAEVLIVANSDSRPEALSKINYPAFAADVLSLRTKHEGLWTIQMFLSDEQYPKAVLVAETFKSIMAERHHLILQNDLEAHPSKRWQDVKLRYRVIDKFALEKSLTRPQEEHLHLELEKYLASLRKPEVNNKEAQYRQACEEWWRQVSGK